jgi:hypothetical protein
MDEMNAEESYPIEIEGTSYDGGKEEGGGVGWNVCITSWLPPEPSIQGI